LPRHTNKLLFYRSWEFAACKKLLSFGSWEESVLATILRASLVARGCSNAKTRELSKALAAIWQPVSLRATIANFHLCPLKRQNLSAVAPPTPQLCRSLLLSAPSRIFVNTSRYAIFPACRAYARKVSMGGIT